MAGPHECTQDGRLKAIEDRLRNGQDDFRELRNDIKVILQRSASTETKINGVADCLDSIDGLKEDVATLKAQARNWGMVAGAVVAIIINAAGAVMRKIL